jgi:hypothetical protein
MSDELTAKFHETVEAVAKKYRIPVELVAPRTFEERLATTGTEVSIQLPRFLERKPTESEQVATALLFFACKEVVIQGDTLTEWRKPLEQALSGVIEAFTDSAGSSAEYIRASAERAQALIRNYDIDTSFRLGAELAELRTYFQFGPDALAHQKRLDSMNAANRTVQGSKWDKIDVAFRVYNEAIAEGTGVREAEALAGRAVGRSRRTISRWINDYMGRS